MSRTPGSVQRRASRAAPIPRRNGCGWTRTRGRPRPAVRRLAVTSALTIGPGGGRARVGRNGVGRAGVGRAGVGRGRLRCEDRVAQRHGAQGHRVCGHRRPHQRCRWFGRRRERSPRRTGRPGGHRVPECGLGGPRGSQGETLRLRGQGHRGRWPVLCQRHGPARSGRRGGAVHRRGIDRGADDRRCRHPLHRGDRSLVGRAVDVGRLRPPGPGSPPTSEPWR